MIVLKLPLFFFLLQAIYAHMYIEFQVNISLYKTPKENKVYKKSHSPGIEKFYFLLWYSRMLFKTIYSPKRVSTFPDHLSLDYYKSEKEISANNQFENGPIFKSGKISTTFAFLIFSSNMCKHKIWIAGKTYLNIIQWI